MIYSIETQSIKPQAARDTYLRNLVFNLVSKAQWETESVHNA